MKRNVLCAAGLAAAALGTGAALAWGGARAGPAEGREEIEAFNKRFLAAHLAMDSAAILGMWADDGVSLLPETQPIIGKPAIAKFLAAVSEQLEGYRMAKMELDFQGIETSGDWASEWANEHQVVEPPPGKPAFDGRGKMLLVLHRDPDGNWRIKREMWNQGERK
jgi:uncharacterized protein (TIGR02246 family)